MPFFADPNYLSRLDPNQNRQTQISPVVTSANPTGIGTGGTTPQDPLLRLLAVVTAGLAQQQNSNTGQGGTDFGSLADALLKIHSGAHLGIGGQPITAANPTGDARNPFNTGFFKSAAERQQVENKRLYPSYV